MREALKARNKILMAMRFAQSLRLEAGILDSDVMQW